MKSKIGQIVIDNRTGARVEIISDYAGAKPKCWPPTDYRIRFIDPFHPSSPIGIDYEEDVYKTELTFPGRRSMGFQEFLFLISGLLAVVAGFLKPFSGPSLILLALASLVWCIAAKFPR